MRIFLITLQAGILVMLAVAGAMGDSDVAQVCPAPQGAQYCDL